MKLTRSLGGSTTLILWLGLVTAYAPTTSAQDDVDVATGKIRIRTVDEAGQPLINIWLNCRSIESFENGFHVRERTDKDGWATISGLPVSKIPYSIATDDRNFAFERVTFTITDPRQVSNYELVLSKGITVAGTIICSDGKPPAGWKILALPTWWNFNSSPTGTAIGEDGSFELPHISTQNYNVSVFIPQGGTSQTTKYALQSTNILELERPLRLNLDYPSASSLGLLTGKLRWIGKPPEKFGIWIQASSIDGAYHIGTSVPAGTTDFSLGPAPPGLYRIEVDYPDVENMNLRNINGLSNLQSVLLPSDDLQIALRVRRRPHLQGQVISEEGKPLSAFRIRIVKVRTLEGPNYTQDDDWKEFSDSSGEFSIEVNSPGIYNITAIADDLAVSPPETVNTIEEPERVVTLELGRGHSLVGLVVDEFGKPIEGATIAANSLLKLNRVQTTSDAGRFEMLGLSGESELLSITHPDFLSTTVQVGSVRNAEPLRITLQAGASMCGQVYDENGEPLPNEPLIVKAWPFSREAPAHTISDTRGRYEFSHLPVGECVVQRFGEWQGLGVLNRTVKLSSQQVLSIDLGGSQKMTGRISINGQPLSKTKIRLAGEDPTQSVMIMVAMTDASGAFILHGPPAGHWSLYYSLDENNFQAWGKLREIDVPASRQGELGLIEHREGDLSVNCVPLNSILLDSARVELLEFNPHWPSARSVGLAVPRTTLPAPFRFSHVPAGDIELVCRVSAPQLLEVRQRIMSTDSPTQRLRVALPEGSASLEGKIDLSLFEPDRFVDLHIWSLDGNIHAVSTPDVEGNFAVDKLPVGEYVLREHGTRDGHINVRFRLTTRKKTLLNLTKKNFDRSNQSIGFAAVQVFDPEGAIIPCHVELVGEAGVVPPNSIQLGTVYYASNPGRYKLQVSHSGFASIQRTIDLFPIGWSVAPSSNCHYDVYLQYK